MLSKLYILLWFLKIRYLRRFRTRKQLLLWQNKKLKELLVFVQKKSAFYKHYYKKNSFKRIEDLPFINKKIMMNNFTKLNTVGITKEAALTIGLHGEETRDFTKQYKKITVGLSSGTSGNRGIFIVNEQETCAWVGAILAKTLPGSIISHNKVAMFLRANSNLYTSLNSKHIVFRYFDLLEEMNTHINTLNEYQPNIVAAPPTVLRLLANAITNKKLNIKPKKIISIADVLEPIDKAYIENAFQQSLHQIYQATEGFIAVTCQYNRLHLNEDLLIIEKRYLDKDRKKFTPIVTDLFRRSQPIIRYELDDILTESETPCLCGSVFTVIDQIEGRCDDLCFLKNSSQELIPLYPDFIRRVIINASEHVSDYKVIQKDFDTFDIQILSKSNNKEDIYNIIQRDFKTLVKTIGGNEVSLSFSTYIPSTPDQKLRRIRREYSLESE